VPLAWFDRRSHHLVTFPTTFDDETWASELAGLVRAGRLRKIEVRKVDGDDLATAPRSTEVIAAAKTAGFTDSYRGLVFQLTSTAR
jgi:ATP-dependent Lhr-like helicase